MEVKICSSCGPTDRYYAKGLCSKCYARAHRKANPEYYRAADKARIEYKRALDRARYPKRKAAGYFKQAYDKHKDIRNADDRARWRRPERKARAKAWREANPDRVRATDRRNYHNDKVSHIARVMERRAHKGKATPKWLSKEQRLQMKEMYQNRPEGHHVDHIVPLKGEAVWGLHVPWNLQYLPAAENLRKSNKFEGHSGRPRS
jgi:hypothetical protein